MSIHFPRRIDFGLRPYKGLTLRQILWLVVAFSSAGLVVLSELGGLSLEIKLALGGLLVGLGLVLAFVPLWGKPLDVWIPILVRFYLSPRRRVWRKGDSLYDLITEPPSETVAVPRTGRTRAADVPLEYSPVGVIIGFWIALSMSSVIVYAARSGLRFLPF